MFKQKRTLFILLGVLLIACCGLTAVSTLIFGGDDATPETAVDSATPITEIAESDTETGSAETAATAEPTDSPTNTPPPTDEPTTTPEPTATTPPTATPQPSPTPRPSPTAEPTNTPQPTAVQVTDNQASDPDVLRLLEDLELHNYRGLNLVYPNHMQVFQDNADTFMVADMSTGEALVFIYLDDAGRTIRSLSYSEQVSALEVLSETAADGFADSYIALTDKSLPYTVGERVIAMASVFGSGVSGTDLRPVVSAWVPVNNSALMLMYADIDGPETLSETAVDEFARVAAITAILNP